MGFLTLLLGIVMASGCAQTVTVRTMPPGAKLTMNDEYLGEAGPDGVVTKVPVGRKPITFQVEKDGVTTQGQVPRTETNWALVATGAGAATVCVPSLVTAGCCVANPLLLFVPLACAATSNPAIAFSSCAALLVAPTWFTLPCAAVGGVAGLSPLALSLFAEQTPKTFVVGAKPEHPLSSPPAASQSPSKAGFKEAMAW